MVNQIDRTKLCPPLLVALLSSDPLHVKYIAEGGHRKSICRSILISGFAYIKVKQATVAASYYEILELRYLRRAHLR